MDEKRATPFDDYAEASPNGQPGRRIICAPGARSVLRVVSAIALGLAILGACVVLALDCIHFFGPALLSWRLKSAFPLIFVGISYACLQFTLPRSWKEFLLSMAVGAAFILWGIEQFAADHPALAVLIDDVVVFLFVLDLSIVIRGYLKEKRL